MVRVAWLLIVAVILLWLIIIVSVVIPTVSVATAIPHRLTVAEIGISVVHTIRVIPDVRACESRYARSQQGQEADSCRGK